VEFGETTEAAAVREAQEETGLSVALDGLLGAAEVPGVGEERYFIYDYGAHCVGARRSPIPGGDASEARFVPIDDLRGLDLVDGLEQWLIDHGVF
jgi:ADP-ribose pyrophosphatase YjhB (NUDIX family)